MSVYGPLKQEVVAKSVVHNFTTETCVHSKLSKYQLYIPPIPPDPIKSKIVVLVSCETLKQSATSWQKMLRH